MAKLFDFTQYFETTLSKSGGLTDSETAGIVLNSITGVDDYSRPGSVCLTFSDPLGTDYEWITYTSINNSTKELNGVVRGAYGSTAKAHLNGCRVAFTLSKGALKGLRDRLEELETGWTPFDVTCTYASSTTFTISGDYTSTFTKGTRIKLTNSGTKYFVVASSSYGAPNTTVTVTGGTDYTVANAAITSVYYSYEASPQGYPSTFNYTPTLSSGTGSITTSSITNAKFWVVGNVCNIQVTFLITTNGTANSNLNITYPITASSATSQAAFGENITDLISLCVTCQATDKCDIRKYDGTYPGINGKSYSIGLTIFI